MIADEHDQQAVGSLDLREPITFAVRGGQIKIDGAPTEFTDGSGSHEKTWREPRLDYGHAKRDAAFDPDG
jgi:hypothetical protein